MVNRFLLWYIHAFLLDLLVYYMQPAAGDMYIAIASYQCCTAGVLVNSKRAASSLHGYDVQSNFWIMEWLHCHPMAL